MGERLTAPQYLINPLAPFPRKWRDHIGTVTVMAGPVSGWLMVRRPGAAPFVLSVRQILNTEPHATHGPFICLEARKNRRPGAARLSLSGESRD